MHSFRFWILTHLADGRVTRYNQGSTSSQKYMKWQCRPEVKLADQVKDQEHLSVSTVMFGVLYKYLTTWVCIFLLWSAEMFGKENSQQVEYELISADPLFAGIFSCLFHNCSAIHHLILFLKFHGDH